MPDDVKPYPLITDAIRRGDVSALAAHFNSFPEMVNLSVPGFGTWLHYACAHGSLSCVRFLVECGFDINAPDHRGGQRPIAYAASENNVEVVRYLLDYGAILDVSTSLRNPLFAAIATRSCEVARLLLDRGVDSMVKYNTQTMKNMDAVAFAMMHGARDIAREIALQHAGGDEAAAEAAVAEGLRVARENTIPVPPGE